MLLLLGLNCLYFLLEVDRSSFMISLIIDDDPQIDELFGDLSTKTLELHLEVKDDSRL